MTKVISAIPMRGSEDITSRIQPADVFKNYPWEMMKRTLSGVLSTFGHWCSIIIGLLTLINITKNIVIYFSGCCAAKRVSRDYK